MRLASPTAVTVPFPPVVKLSTPAAKMLLPLMELADRAPGTTCPAASVCSQGCTPSLGSAAGQAASAPPDAGCDPASPGGKLPPPLGVGVETADLPVPQAASSRHRTTALGQRWIDMGDPPR